MPGDVLVDDYHGNSVAGTSTSSRPSAGDAADAIAAGKPGVLFRQPESGPAACDGAHAVDSRRDLRRLFGV